MTGYPKIATPVGDWTAALTGPTTEIPTASLYGMKIDAPASLAAPAMPTLTAPTYDPWFAHNPYAA